MSEYMYQKNWVTLYPEGFLLPKNIPLFGVRVQTKLLPKKSKTPQCSKCFGWHNERSCSRPQRCRICGSTKHVENEHASCAPETEHKCPPKCANCHGPHPADSLECLIRPKKDQKLPTRSEIAKIRQAASAARMRLVAAHCKPISTQQSTQVTTADDYTNNAPPTTPQATRRLFSVSPSPARGRFAVLQAPYESRSNSPSRMDE